MACPEFENRIFEYLEDRLSPGERAVVEAHLAECSHCQGFARQLQRLDDALLHSVKAPNLSAEFGARLQRCSTAVFARRAAWQVPRELRRALVPILRTIAA